MAYEARAAQSPLIIRVTTDRHVYRLQRQVLIILTETNTSDHEVWIAFSCQILHDSSRTTARGYGRSTTTPSARPARRYFRLTPRAYSVCSGTAAPTPACSLTPASTSSMRELT